MSFDLICGEGRIDAFRMLGESRIPAIIIDADDETCLVMSLVAKITRHPQRPIELVRDVGRLQRCGYTDLQIAEKIGDAPDWVKMVRQFLARGEERLTSAAVAGLIPASLAIDIARSNACRTKNILTKACKEGKVRGKSLACVHRLLELPLKPSRHLGSGRGPTAKASKLSPANLISFYESEIEAQRQFIEKSYEVERQLFMAVKAMTDLLSDDGFSTLLQAERQLSIPAVLAERMVQDVG